ncbi:hypothetical protein E4U31_003803 [Claviceps sp. LM219 group G6]|nr:hypothetical protein E4U31_003803 [Claviceps sp. LM219 group G6]
MRDLLEVNGIYIGKGSGSKIAESLHRVVTRYMCDDGDDDGEIEKLKEPKMDMHFNEQGDLVTDGSATMVTSAWNFFSNNSKGNNLQAEIANMKAELKAAQEYAAKLEATHLNNSRSRQGPSSKTPDICAWMPYSFDAIGMTDDQIRRCLADFNKMYKDSDKYSGERYQQRPRFSFCKNLIRVSRQSILDMPGFCSMTYKFLDCPWLLG